MKLNRYVGVILSFLAIVALSAPLSVLADDHSDNYQNATPVTVGLPASGDLESNGDVDYFSFAAAEGGTYVIEVTQDTLDDSVLYLYGIDGTTNLEFDDDSGNGYAAKIEWTCNESGIYYVAVAGYWYGSRGTYTLSITCTGVCFSDDHGDDPSQATTVSIGSIIDAEIDPPEDEDWFRIPAEAGSIYSIEIRLDTLNDSFLYFYDTDNLTMINSDDNSGVGNGSLITW